MEDELLDDDGMVIENRSSIYYRISIICGVAPLIFLAYFAARTMGPRSVGDSLNTITLPPIFAILLVILPIAGGVCSYLAVRRRESSRLYRIIGIFLNALSAVFIYGSVVFALIMDYLNNV